MYDLIFGPWIEKDYEARANYGQYRYTVPEYFRWSVSERHFIKIWFDDIKRQYSIVCPGATMNQPFFDDALDAMRYFDEVMAVKFGIKVLSFDQFQKLKCMT